MDPARSAVDRRGSWMGSRTWVRFLVVLGLMLPVGAMSGVATATASGSGSSVQRYIVVVRSGAGYSAVRSLAVRGGAQVLADLPGIRAIVIKASSSARDAVAADSRTLQVVADHVETIAQPEQRLVKPGTLRPRTVRISGPARSAAPVATVRPDPSFHSPGLVW